MPGAPGQRSEVQGAGTDKTSKAAEIAAAAGAAGMVENVGPIFTDQEKQIIQQYEGSLAALSAKLKKPDEIGEFSQEYRNASEDVEILADEERFNDQSEQVRRRLKEILTKLRESLALVDMHDREAARKKRITSFPGHTPGYIKLEDAEQDIHVGIEGSGRRMTVGSKELFVKSLGVGEGGRENHTKNLMALAQTQKRLYTAAQTALGADSVAHSDIAIGRSQLNYNESADVYGANNKVNTFSEYVPKDVNDTLRTSEENNSNITRELSDEGKYVRRLALRYPSSSSDKEAIDIRNRNRELLAPQRDALTRYLQAVRLGLLVGYLPDIQMQTGYFNKRVDCLIIMNHNIRLTQDGEVKLIDYGYPRLNVLSPSQMERLRAQILQKEQAGEAAYTYDQASKKYVFAPWYTEALNAAFKADFEAYAQEKNGVKKLGFGDSKTQIQPAHVDPRTGQSFYPSIALGHNKIDRAQDFTTAEEYATNMSQILLASLSRETIREDADQYSGYLGNLEASKALLTDAVDGKERNQQPSGAGGHTPLPDALRGANDRAETAPEQLGQPTVNEANRVLESWTNFTQSQKTENPTLSFDRDSSELRLAIANFLNARNRREDPAKVSGLLEALKAQIPISQRNLEAAMADPVAYANAEAALRANRLNSLQ